MSGTRKSGKSKFLPKDMSDFLVSQATKKSPKPKKGQKRQIDADEGGDISQLIGMYEMNAKKKKLEANVESKETRQKLLEVFGSQLDARKQMSSELLKRLSDVISQLEGDYDVLKENEQKLEHLAGVFLKCIQQTTTAQKQKLKLLKEIHSSFMKQVEGLLTRGAMKPDDRPLWFDIYRAFPPTIEPKFARPKPEIKPIRQIFYPEDAIRAKFHAKGHGLGMVNMLNPTGDTQTKKLVQQYEKLKSEGVPESDLIDRSVEAVGIERQQEAIKITHKNPDSVTAQVLKDADLKNIFKEDLKK